MLAAGTDHSLRLRRAHRELSRQRRGPSIWQSLPLEGLVPGLATSSVCLEIVPEVHRRPLCQLLLFCCDKNAMAKCEFALDHGFREIRVHRARKAWWETAGMAAGAESEH